MPLVFVYSNIGKNLKDIILFFFLLSWLAEADLATGLISVAAPVPSICSWQCIHVEVGAASESDELGRT